MGFEGQIIRRCEELSVLIHTHVANYDNVVMLYRLLKETWLKKEQYSFPRENNDGILNTSIL